jgi:hypothetical protein
MSKSYSFPANLSLTVTAQNVALDVTPADFAAEALESIFAYGVRRWFQDNVNSAAKIARDAGVEFDALAAMNARLEAAKTGVIRTRGAASASADPLDAYRITIARKLMQKGKAPALAKSYKAIPSDDQPARTAHLLAWATAHAATVEPLAIKAKADDDEFDAAMPDLAI